jgi:hypothetical protein
MSNIKKKRKRIVSPRNITAVQLVASEFDVTYKRALKAYNSAKLYCKVFKDKTVLEETEFLLLTAESNIVYKI